MASTQYNPLRVPKTPEQAAANRANKDLKDLSVTGTLYKGEEATVIISVGDDEWHYMDAEYALRMIQMLMEVTASALNHNKELAG